MPKKYHEFFPTLFVKTTDFQLVFTFEQTPTVTIFREHGMYIAKMKTPENKDLSPENEDPKMQTPKIASQHPKNCPKTKNSTPFPPFSYFLLFWRKFTNDLTLLYLLNYCFLLFSLFIFLTF